VDGWRDGIIRALNGYQQTVKQNVLVLSGPFSLEQPIALKLQE
jgi:hypothetical protein